MGRVREEKRRRKKIRVRSHVVRWEMSKKCTPLWREARFQVKIYKAPHVHATFGRWSVVLRGRRKGLCTLSKVSKTWGFCSMSKNNGKRGTFEEDLQRCIFRGRRSARDMFIRAVRRSGRWFPERGCTLEHQICRFAKMILRDRCSTSYDLASLFRGRGSNYFRQVEWKNRKMHWYKAVSSALNFPYLKNISQNCFAFDVVKFKNWGSLAELLRFQACRKTDRDRQRQTEPDRDRQRQRQTDIDRQRQTDRDRQTQTDKQIDR